MDAPRQKAWDAPRVAASVKALQEAAPDVSALVRLLADSSKEAGAWLRALPVSSLGLRMEENVFCVATGLRLGVPLYQPHKCQQWGTPVDGRGTHGLHYRKSVGCHSRHSAINNVIKRSLGVAKISAHLELVGMCRSDWKRSDGATVLSWRSGRILVWDATCLDTFARRTLTWLLGEQGLWRIRQKRGRRQSTLSWLLLTLSFLSPWQWKTLGFLDQRHGHFFESSAAKSSMKQVGPWPTNIFCNKLQWPCTGGTRLQRWAHPPQTILI